MQRRNLAARAGRWSAQHRKQAIFGWLAFVIAAAVGGGALGMNTFAWQENGPGESGRADKAIFDAFPRHASETVLVQTRTGSAGDPAFHAAVTDVERRLAGVQHVSRVAGPYDEGRAGQISRDGRSALISFEIAGDYRLAQDRVDPALAAVAAAALGDGRRTAAGPAVPGPGCGTGAAAPPVQAPLGGRPGRADRARRAGRPRRGGGTTGRGVRRVVSGPAGRRPAAARPRSTASRPPAPGCPTRG
jgi:hypothetical protein